MGVITKEMVAEELDLDRLEAMIFLPFDGRFKSVFIVCDEKTESEIMARLSDNNLFKVWGIVKFYRWEELKTIPVKPDFSYHLNMIAQTKSLGKVFLYQDAPWGILDPKKKGIRA